MPFTDDDREKLTELHTIVVQYLIPAKADHEIRIRSIERGRFKEMGAIGVVGSVIGYFATHLFR